MGGVDRPEIGKNREFPLIGTRFNNRYRLDEELGQGGMGTVYSAHDDILKHDVAVKLLSVTGL